jgi:hypothetical protein
MSQLLGTILEELGIAQYLDVFLQQGFDTWETILDITESDLYVRGGVWGARMRERPGFQADWVFFRSDALGVKLGHRRVRVLLSTPRATAASGIAKAGARAPGRITFC